MELSFAKKAKPFVFLKEVRTELTKVSWPSREQAIRLTLIVIATTVVAALFLGAFDLLFTNLAGLVIRK
ncbi:preprotein translocase subunit SecE [Microgenomates group bacterium RBG_19FT_COMBO_39_10]|nr:MAG: preprotein translocase subunit SecE [Microgenomates group bacterium RBG_19FT_COMBO_39_10]